MGSRKRSKPNPKAEGEQVPDEAPLCQGPKLQSEDSLKPVVGEPVSSDEPEGVEPVHLSVNAAKTVSAEVRQLVNNGTNFV